jgi:hypothetical protein
MVDAATATPALTESDVITDIELEGDIIEVDSRN